MPRTHFTVSQIRVAASCPRILYFDAAHMRREQLKTPCVTRIWKTGAGSETTACGTLFHAAVEKFNGQAAADPAVCQLFQEAADAEKLAAGLLNHVYWNCLNQDKLFEKTGPQQQAFLAALRTYVGELADILLHARTLGRPPDEVLDRMFGDRRRRVDVTFPVGPAGEEVHVTGLLDYVFWDWRTGDHRILDYKLTPATAPVNDLFQVCVYGLMHHAMHQTRPSVGVLYLHPKRELVPLSWEEVNASRPKVLALLASMRAWVGYDERGGRGLKPPGEPQYCPVCKWAGECERRLGPKTEGQRISYTAASGAASAPRVVREELPGLTPPGSPLPALTQPGSPLPALTRPGSPAGQLWIGRAPARSEPVHLPASALPTHLTVVGAAGSGKTWLAKVIAEEAILQGVPVLAIDPQGDLVQFLRPTTSEQLDPEEKQRRDRYWQLVEPRVFTPGSSHGIRLCLSPLRLPRREELTSTADPRRREEELDAVLASVAGNVVNLAQAGGEVKAQETFVLQILRRLTEHGGARGPGLEDVIAAVGEPESVGIGEPDLFVKKTERTKLARMLNALLHGTAANLFTGGTPLDLGRLRQPSRPGKVPLNVIYLNALPDDRQKQNFVAALATEVYRWMISAGAEGAGARLLLYLDEARDFIPAGTRQPPAKGPLMRLFAQGRKYGVAGLICTQSPRSVEYQVLGNCSTKLVGRLESAQDVDRVADWFAVQGASPQWLRGRQEAAKGTFVGRWPDMPETLEGQTIQSRNLFSLHEGAWSPDRVEQAMREQPAHG